MSAEKDKNQELKDKLEQAKADKAKAKQAKREAKAKAREEAKAKRHAEREKELNERKSAKAQSDKPNKEVPAKEVQPEKAEKKADKVKQPKPAKPKAEKKPKSPEDNIFKNFTDKGFLSLKGFLNGISTLLSLGIIGVGGYLEYLLLEHPDVFFNSLVTQAFVGVIILIGIMQAISTLSVVGKAKNVGYLSISISSSLGIIAYALLQHFAKFHDLDKVTAYGTLSYHLLIALLFVLIGSAVFALIASLVSNYVIKKPAPKVEPAPIELGANKPEKEERTAPRKEEKE